MDAPRRRQPSGTTRPGSRSSRRILSGGVPVELGGGVGVLGTVLNGEGSSPTSPTYSYNLYTRSSPTASSFASAGSGGAPPPLPPKSSPPRKGSVPLPRTATPPIANATSSQQPASSSALPPPFGGGPQPAFSHWSTSWSVSPSKPTTTTTTQAKETTTVASSSLASSSTSTSTRTPTIVPVAGPSQALRASGGSSSGTSASSSSRSTQPSKGTDTVRSLDKARSEGPPPIPQMAQGPLPPAPAPLDPSSTSTLKSTTMPLKDRVKNIPPPIRTDHEHNPHNPPRLSSDWVRVDDFGDLVSDFAPGRRAPNPKAQQYSTLSKVPHTLRAGSGDDSGSKQQQRAATDPVPRMSNDISRSLGSNGNVLNGRPSDVDGGRGRASIDEAPVASSSRWGLGRNNNNSSNIANNQGGQPTLRPRRSADFLRGEFLGLGVSKESREAKAQAQAQRQASASTTASAPPPAGSSEKGISLKKSSGALRNLFRGAKPSREPFPDVPKQSRPSSTFSDILRPSPVVRSNQTPLSVSAPFQPDSPPGAKASFTQDHRRYPTPPLGRTSLDERGPFPILQVGSKLSLHGDDSSSLLKPSSSSTSGPSPTPSYVSSFHTTQSFHSSPSLVSEPLSPAPSPVPSPIPPPTSKFTSSPVVPQGPTEPSKSASAELRKSKLPPRSASRDALGSAPVPEVPPVPPMPSTLPGKAVSPVGSDGGASSGSTSTVRGLGSSPSLGSLGASDGSGSGSGHSPMKIPDSINLLQLPELDLNFDFSFDGFDAASSPTTPRRRSSSGGKRSAPSTPSRSRANSSPRMLTPTVQQRAERRRSKSFDLSANEEPWRALSFDQMWSNKMFNGSASTSAPRLASGAGGDNDAALATAAVAAAATAATAAAVASVTEADQATSAPAPAAPAAPTSSEADSLSTHGTSLDHSRTPSGGSSTNETNSPSPPRTPEDAHAAFPAVRDEAPKVSSALDAPLSLSAMDGPALGRGIALEDYRPPAPAVDITPSSSEQATPTKQEVTTPKADTSLQLTDMPTPTPKAAPAPAPVPQAERPILAVQTERSAPELEKPVPKVERPAPPAKSAARRAAQAKRNRPKTPPKPKLKPLSVHPNPAKPPRELEEPAEPEQIPASKAPFRCRPMVRTLISQAKIVMNDPKVTIRDLTQELERSLDSFRYPLQAGGPERSMLIRNELMVYVAELDRRRYERREEAAYRDLREVCFDWADSLLFELRVEQPANERGACLEGLAAILECQCLAAHALDASPSHQDAFLHLMMRVMNFVMDKLGAKGVFHNTLLFSGRFLAFAFFRIPHVGGQLVGVLQPPRGALQRFTRPVLVGQQIPREAQPDYPEHLHSLCFDDSMSYTRRLLSLDPDFDTPAEKEAFHFQPGNWLRRWQSDDSELFPAFYRAYHKQLAQYLAPAVGYYQLKNKPLPAHVLFRAPGYAHLATIFSLKCHSYILGSVNAVTTSSSNQQFDASESAAFRGSQKPAVLETANRRLVETLWMFASQPICIPTPDSLVIQCDGAQLWGEMIDLWMKNLITRTSLYSPKGVFCLFDLIDGLVDPVVYNGIQSPLDVPYLIGTVRTVLNHAEHALTIVKVIAFVFTHWEILTARPEDRRELCLSILLERRTFERLLLFWSQSVRSYVLRLVVFRLGHLHTTAQEGLSYEVEIESVRLLNTRLDQIKRRYDELEPNVDSVDGGSLAAPRTPTTPGMPRSRSTITMVTDSPRAISKAEKLLGLGLGERDGDEPKGKASWWKSKFGKQKKKADSPKSPDDAADGQLPSRLSELSITSNGSGGAASPRPGSVHSAHSGRSGPKTSSPRQPSKLDQSTTAASSASPRLGPSLLPPDAGTGTSPTSFGSPRGMGTRKSPPPAIDTARLGGPPAPFAFEFELPTASPLSDTFEANKPTSPRGSNPTSPRASSPHMSHSFSKRSSLLPPPAAVALEGMHSVRITPPDREPGYPPRLHAYAIRMLAELEDAQKEYDEWWSEGGIGKVDGAPPRLAVAWPFSADE